MPVTVIGDHASPQYPGEFVAPVIEVADSWAAIVADPVGAWQFNPDLELISCAVHASSSAASSLTFRRRFGTTKAPFQTDFSDTQSLPLTGKIARMSIIGDQGPEVQFVGPVVGRNTELMGTDTTPAGIEVFVAYGGVYLLKKQDVYQSVFANPDNTIATVDWVPAMNMRDRRNTLVGNKAESPNVFTFGPWLYGGTDVWTHYDYLLYILANFLSVSGGPAWSISGQIDVLAGLKTTIAFPQVLTVADMLRDLIPVKYGLDYLVRPTDVGYEIVVFALTDQGASLAGVTTPKNPNTVQVHKVKESALLNVHVVESAERRVDQIVVQGKRIVVCGSLLGKSLGSLGADQSNPSLVKKWTDALEYSYKLADGLADTAYPIASKCDEKRATEKYREVYQHLGAPVGWDMDQGRWSLQMNPTSGAITVGEWQTTRRETLTHTPLKVGFVYTANPPIDNTLSDTEPGWQPPIVWILDENTDPSAPVYVEADKLPQHAMHVSVAAQDWGVLLNASPNHILALNHWPLDNASYSSSYPPLYDYDTAIATIAIESDHRVQVAYAIPSSLSSGDGSVEVVQDDGAECHVLLAGTVVGVDNNGMPVNSPGQNVILRNDVDRLALVACGLYTRYINDRVKVQMHWKGHAPWGGLVGSIMDVLVQGMSRRRIGAPITSVEWSMSGGPQTIIRTGYA